MAFGNGFVFTDYTPEAMLNMLQSAVALYRGDPKEWPMLQERGMKEEHSRGHQRNYLSLYERLA